MHACMSGGVYEVHKLSQLGCMASPLHLGGACMDLGDSWCMVRITRFACMS
jgi:hypothetical protein